MHNVTETETMTGYTIESHPSVHIMHGRLSDLALKKTLDFVTTLSESNATTYSLDNINPPSIQTWVDYGNEMMKPYVDETENAIKEYISHCCDPLNPKYQQKLERTITIQDCWCIKMNKGDYMPMHSHRTTAKTGISTVLYLKVPDKLADPKNQYASIGGGLTLSWPSNNVSVMEDDVNPSNARHIYPVVGEFWIFPKWLSHVLNPYRFEGERWGMASNWNIWMEDGR